MGNPPSPQKLAILDLPVCCLSYICAFSVLYLVMLYGVAAGLTDEISWLPCRIQHGKVTQNRLDVILLRSLSVSSISFKP